MAAVIQVIRRSGLSSIELHPLGPGDSLDEAIEELAPVTLTALIGVLALKLQDRHKLRTGLEEPAS
jgi:hypothetical protein